MHYLCSCVLKSFEMYFQTLGKGVLWVHKKVGFIMTDTVVFSLSRAHLQEQLCHKTDFAEFCVLKLFCFLVFALKQEIIHDIAIK